MVFRAKIGLKPDPQISYGARKGKVVDKKGNSGDGRGTELVRGANTNGFGFGAIELQDVFTHSSLYLLQAGVHLRDRG